MPDRTDTSPEADPTAARSTSGGSIYDRIAKARKMREKVLSERPAAPAEPGAAAVTPRLKETDSELAGAPAPAARADAGAVEPGPSKGGLRAAADGDAPRRGGTDEVQEVPEMDTPEPDTPKREDAGTGRKRAAGLWWVSAVIACLAVGVVFWGSRPGGFALTDLVPTFSFFDTPPEIAGPPEELPLVAFGGDPGDTGLAGAAWLPPARVDFGDMPVVPGLSADGFDPDASAVSARDLRVVLHAPATVSDDNLQAVIDALTESGAEPDPRRVNLTISASNVRFYHPEDQAAAAAIADGIGARLRDFTSFQPRPPEGLVEIWLAGQQIGTRTGQRSAGTFDQFRQDLRRLELGLRRALRGN